jgi:hypothetical protein
MTHPVVQVVKHIMAPAQWGWDLRIWLPFWSLFLVLEMLGVWRKVPFTKIAVPWTSFSRFIWESEARWPFLVLISIFACAILGVHFAARWPGNHG